MKKLRDYLEKYYDYQKEIILCYRPSNEGKGSSWGDRCLFRGEGFNDRKEYNHRVVLDNEVVIEFDDDDKELNKKATDEVIKRLRKDGVKYARWFSGSKSEHVHFFIDAAEASRMSTLKKAVIRHYTKGLDIKPDMGMGNSNHLIRAEYGVNEKTGNKKKLLSRSPGYPELNPVPQEAWNLYIESCQRLLKAEMTRTVNNLSESELIKNLLDTTYFNDKVKDGRSRIVFVLANVLCGKYEKRDLIDTLINWYKYTGGRKLSPGQIAYTVHRAYKQPYAIGPAYLQSLMDDIQH